MRYVRTRRVAGLGLLLAVLLGVYLGQVTLEGQTGPFSAQIVRALRAYGLLTPGVFTGSVRAPDGSASAPSYSFASAPTRGLYNDTVNSTIGVAFAGVEGIRLGADQVSILSNNAILRMGASVTLVAAYEGNDHWFQRRTTNAQRASWANTYTSSTNYEAFSVDWQTTANVATVGTRTAATGTARTLRLVAQNSSAAFATSMLALQGSTIGAPMIRGGLLELDGATQPSSPATGDWIRFGEGVSTATSGTVSRFVLLPTYNQSASTAANTDLLINRTETAVGSGTQLLIDAQVGGTSKFSVQTTGTTTLASNASLVFGSRGIFNPVSNGLLNFTEIGAAFGVQFNVGTAAPTVSSCGTGTVTAGSRNIAGEVTATGATSCTVNFGAPAWTNQPFCVIEERTTNLATEQRISAISTTSFTVTGLTSGDTFMYICLGRI